ncbi:DUF502 domain-containing protein [Oleispirillum naphthae]|uniref:DUF502 domain-containing protein n=1 Tax=Oleispirillum naphthae TaxID=2838853 RepID=UPI003082449D
MSSPPPAGAKSPGKKPLRGKVKPRTTVFARLRGYFFAGLLVTAPAALTLYLAWLFISVVDSQVGSLLPPRYRPGIDIPGFGVLVLLAFLTLVGALTAGLIGRLMLRWWEGILNRMPVISSIYGALKQLFEAVLSNQSSAFRQCVLVEYPRRGIWALGFISGVTEGEVQRLTENEVLNVFLPTTPNPTSGFLLFVPRSDLVILEMTVEEGIKMVISGGIVTPPDRAKKDPHRIKGPVSRSAASPRQNPAKTDTKGT